MRPDWNEYFMNIARDISLRGTCLCVRIGAIIVKNKRIISSGYVGSPRKTKDCIERGICLRRQQNIPSGERYELCRSVHAEQNAIINAARDGQSVDGADIYLYGMRISDGTLLDVVPCFICKKMIINAGINNVFTIAKNGGIRKFSVDRWTKDWQEKDMLDDMHIYKTSYPDQKE